MSMVSHILNTAYVAAAPRGLIGHGVHYGVEDRVFSRAPGALYSYLLAGDGVYLVAERGEIGVSFRVAAAQVRGLEPAAEFFKFRLPRVPEVVVQEVFDAALRWAAEGKECLWHLSYSPMNPWNDGWLVEEPEQERTAATCRPLESGGSHDRAILEIHSHHSMAARFSSQDDADETGFRLYAVIGRLPNRPEIRLRVGVYGQFWEIPAIWVMELPEDLRDCNAI